jgi:hypothetical protein
MITYTQDVASDRSTANTAVHVGEEGDYTAVCTISVTPETFSAIVLDNCQEMLVNI